MIGCACPLCGTIIERDLLVDLHSNIAILSNVPIRLTPKEAEILSLLADQFPGEVQHTRMITKVYGVNEPTNAKGCISTMINRLKKKIWPAHYTIVSRAGARWLVRIAK